MAAAAAAARQYSAQQHSLEQQMSGSGNVVEDGGGGGGVSGAVGGGNGISCGELQSLTLSMSPGSQSSCITAPRQISPTGAECKAMETKKRGPGKAGQKQTVHRKSIDTFGQRTSQFRGVTRLVQILFSSHNYYINIITPFLFCFVFLLLFILASIL